MELTKKLIEDLREGDQKAFEKIYEENYVRLVSYVDTYIEDKNAAEDITMEFFEELPILVRDHLYDSPKNFERWMFRSVRNRGLNYRRTQKGKRNCEYNEELGSREEKGSTFRIEELKRILDATEYKLIVYRFVEDLNFQEISREMNMSIDRLKKISAKALKKVKAYYEELIK